MLYVLVSYGNIFKKKEKLLPANQQQNETWLIMPVLNERENLSWLLPELVGRYNVLVVDNNSDDGSFELAETLGAHCTREPNRGYGSAVLRGLQYIEECEKEPEKDPIVVIYDADGSSPFSAIEEVVSPVATESADLVIAQRTHRLPKAMPIHAKFGNWLQVFLIEHLTSQRYTDMGPLRAMRLSHFRFLNMRDPTWAWNIEMQVKAAILGLTITEIFIEYLPRKYGHSKISGSIIGSLKAGTRIIWGVGYYFLEALKLKKRKSTPDG